MEDEDNENGLVDTWSLWEEAYYKEASIVSSLAQINNSNSSLNDVHENREDSFYDAYVQDSDGNGNSDMNLKNVIKGLKQNIQQQTQENQTDIFDIIGCTQLEVESNNVSNERNNVVGIKTEKMAEYTQYLGLQPAATISDHGKWNHSGKLAKLEENTKQCNNPLIKPSHDVTGVQPTVPSNISALPPTQNSESLVSSNSEPASTNIELSNINTIEETTNKNSDETNIINSNTRHALTSSEIIPSNHPSQSSNFKIARKVYLCAACETYFENWNLFLHMREVHKRHICLFCLGMFGQAERLSHHLSKKHSVPEMSFDSLEDFYKIFKGSCYIICCSCEKTFSETDNFYNHFCLEENQQSSTKECLVCRQVNSHLETCNLFLEKSGKTFTLQSSINSLKLSTTNSLSANQTVTSIRRYSKRTIKPNRLNDDVYLYTKLTNIRTKRTKLQNTSDASETSEINNVDFQTIHSVIESKAMEVELLQNLSNPTATEVPNRMETLISNKGGSYSKNFVGTNINEDKDGKLSTNEGIKNLGSSSTEVEKCTNNSNSEYENKTITDKINEIKNIDYNISKGTYKSSDPKSEDNVRLSEVSNKPDKTKDFVDIQNSSNSDTESEASSNGTSSPTNRSLFSPSCEAVEETLADNKNNVVRAETENKLTAIATTATDRSLVIKICTKNNSVFSISSAACRNSSSENLNSSRESDKNNPEVSENMVPEENDVINKHFLNEQESDSDNEKLTLVDYSEDNSGIGSITIESDTNKENKPNLALNNMNNKHEKKSNEQTNKQDDLKVDVMTKIEGTDDIALAGEEIPTTDLNVDGLLESMEIEDLLKRCIQAVCAVCVYCNHARHIAVNAKQLSLHMLAEHRFQPQHPAIIIQQEQFTIKVKKYLNDLKSYYFNLDSYNSKEGTYNIPTVRVYECFHCRFCSSAHKELYLHNRKMHQKPILICIMCKSTFYSYSELLCHLCPGVYAANVNVQFRCCLCSLSNFPSSFRLMVHLRKQHHACDVCLESTDNQQRLSNHVWKHKLHHLCYRCGIAYRNKPDITKHLFWKHGTESVLCKKCLQKKWPHIYHFCIPPTAFVCEECGHSFSRAVALKVHKRTHTGDFPYCCTECTEKFISKKLLLKHQQSHKEPPLPPSMASNVNSSHVSGEEEVHVDICNMETKDYATETNTDGFPKETVKKVVDVYDLPPLNLSSESESEVEDEKLKENKDDEKSNKNNDNPLDELEQSVSDPKTLIGSKTDVIVEVERNEEEKKQEKQIMDGIWDNFKSYTASLEKQDSSTLTLKDTDAEKHTFSAINTSKDIELVKRMISADHDYCVIYSDNNEDEILNKSSAMTNIDCSTEMTLDRTPSPALISMQNTENDSTKKKIKSPKKKRQNVSTSSSDSSSDSDSSSCSCGTNCSCSSSSSSNSSSSSSSSDSDSDSTSESSPQKMNSKEKRKKEKENATEEEKIEVVEDMCNEVIIEKNEQSGLEKVEKVESVIPVTPVQLVIMESDLDTTETETDEDFYDENPQLLANKLLAEKRNKLMQLAVGVTADFVDSNVSAPLNNGVVDTDTTGHTLVLSPAQTNPLEPSDAKTKIKTRRHKKGARTRTRTTVKTVDSVKLNIPKSKYQRKEMTAIHAVAGRHSISNLAADQSIFETNQIAISESSSTLGTTQSAGGSGSETDAKRSSKRKRVPKRFYGDSSDEENHRQQMLKWRRVDTPLAVKPETVSKSFGYKQKQHHHHHRRRRHRHNQQHYQQLQQEQEQQLFQQQQHQHQQRQQQQQEQHHHHHHHDQDHHQHQQQQLLEAEEDADDERALVIAASDSESKDNSTESSDSPAEEEEIGSKTNLASANNHCPQIYSVNTERSSNLYCYCQCPYDEVSEMIACDGDDCQIEWFHFECVGIMVPPKGKWYCPDCRRKLGIPDDVEDFANG